MNIKLRALASVSIFSLLSLMGGSAALADFTAVNDHTGYNSENTVEASAENGLVTVNTNLEVIANETGGFASTGDNSSSENTGQGEVLSGDLAAFGDLFNEVNLNASQSMGSFESDFFAKNTSTGAESDNSAESELENNFVFENVNEACIENSAFIKASTGKNEADENTGMGRIESGDGEVSITESNQANGNSLEMDSDIDNESFSAMAVNDTTGADSDNDVEAELENNIEIENVNLADIGNWVFAKIDTGHNSASENTGSADIDTGDASAMADIENQVNMSSNSIDIDPTDPGDIVAMNKTTGHNSDNDAEAQIKNNVAVANSNWAGIGNFVKIKASTGHNSADENTGSVDLSTGDAETNVNIENGSFLNKNTTDINLNLGGIGVSATNDTTGADSDNDASASLENNVTVENSNEAELYNSVHASSDTGHNSADENTGSADVSTGDATSDVTITNELNVNDTTIDAGSSGDVSATNTHTGADSDNEASATMTNDITVVNNNTAFVENNVTSTANTGGNSADYNTGSGSVSTGDSTISFGVNNTANGNSTDISN